MNKRGQQLNVLSGGILVSVLACIFIVMGLIMLDELSQETATESYTVTNETFTTVTETGETVAKSGWCEFQGLSINYCNNATSGTILSSTNYTVSGIKIATAGNGGLYNNTNFNCTYSFKYGGEVCTITNKTMVGVGMFSDYVDLIAIGIIISVLIGVIFWAFSQRQVR